ALDNDGVGGLLGKELVDAGDHFAHDRVQSLASTHDVQVVVRRDLERLVHLIEHLPMLAGDRYDSFHVLGRLDRLDDRGDFDRLRPRAVDRHDSQGHFYFLSTWLSSTEVHDADWSIPASAIARGSWEFTSRRILG